MNESYTQDYGVANTNWEWASVGGGRVLGKLVLRYRLGILAVEMFTC